MKKLFVLLIEKPIRNLVAWLTKHWLIAGLVWLVLWFLPPLAVILYALFSKALGEQIGKVFIETRWAKVAFTIGISVLFPPIGVVFTSWLLLDLFKPDDRITTRTIGDIADQVKQGIAGIFGQKPAETISVETVNEELPTTPPPNPVVGPVDDPGEFGEFNPIIGIDGGDDDDFGSPFRPIALRA